MKAHLTQANVRLALFALTVAGAAMFGRHLVIPHSGPAQPAQKSGGFFKYVFLPVAYAGEEEPIEASVECLETWNALLAIDFGRYGSFNDEAEPSFDLPRYDELFRRLEKIAAMRCAVSEEMPARLQEAVRDFHRDCADIEASLRQRGKGASLWGSGPEGNGVGDVCLTRTLEYRFAATTALHGTRSLSKVDSLPLLLNLFYDEAKDEHRSFERLAKILGRVQELAPTNYQAAKLFVQIAYAYWLSNPSARDTFDRAITYAELLGKRDYQLVELRARQAAHEGDVARLRERANQGAVLGYDGLTSYYLAWANYLDGDREAALGTLRRVFVASTQDFETAGALAMNRLKKAASNPFTEGSLSVGLFFIVPEEQGTTRVTAGDVTAHFFREESYFDNPSPEVKLAHRDLHAFRQAKHRCHRESGGSAREYARDFNSAPASYQRCVMAALDAWGTLEVSLNEGI